MLTPPDCGDGLTPLARCLRIAHARGAAIRAEREREGQQQADRQDAPRTGDDHGETSTAQDDR